MVRSHEAPGQITGPKYGQTPNHPYSHSCRAGPRDFSKIVFSCIPDKVFRDFHPFWIIRIFNGCEVLIENSVMRVTVSQTVIPSDGIFSSHRTVILDSFSCRIPSAIVIKLGFALFYYSMLN